MLYWTIFVIFSLAHATINSKSSIERVRWLADNNFQSFSDMLSLLGGDLTEENATEILSNDNFEPLFNFFEGNLLRGDEVEQVLHLANKYLATGDRMNEIIDMYFKCVIESQVPPPNLIVYGHLHSTLIEYLAIKQLGINTKENVLQLNGWEVNEEKKRALLFFKALAPFYNLIFIENLLMDDSIFDQIQSLLHSNLKAVHFENCSILNPNKYFQLNRLISFKFSNCYCNNFIEMLGTISRDTLIQLDISNNVFNEQEINNLTILFKEFKQLKSLNVSLHAFIDWEGPMFPGDLLNLPNLKSLKAYRNLDVNSFVKVLSDSTELNYLEHLGISCNFTYKPNLELFSNNLSKFIALKELNLSGYHDDNLLLLLSNIVKLQSLEQFLIFGLSITNLNLLIQQNKQRKIPFKISEWFELKSDLIQDINLFERIYLKERILNFVSIDLLPEKFSATELYLCNGLYWPEPSQSLDLFFLRFTNLKKLIIYLRDSLDMKYLKMLLDNNCIARLELQYSQFFTDFRSLIGIMRNKKLRELKITKNEIGRSIYGYVDNSSYMEFLVELGKTRLFEEVESLECEYLSSQSLVTFLNNTNFKRLYEFKITSIDCDDDISISVVLPSVRKLRIMSRSSDELFVITNLSALLQVFPQIAQLEVIIPFSNSITHLNFPIYENLRLLRIICGQVLDRESFIEKLQKIPFLTELFIKTIFEGDPIQVNHGKHLNFPSLIFSCITISMQELENEFAVLSIK